MLIGEGESLYLYSVTRDLGFAPNPFHGSCTLATCKPAIRAGAQVGDWVAGIAGANFRKSKGRCIYIMQVSEKITFQEYWEDKRFELKKPSRNGSMVQMVGDNIYHKNESGKWVQENSHHSNKDGSINEENLHRDTGKTSHILVSKRFIYFGRHPALINLESVGYRKVRNCKKITLDQSPAGKKMITDLLNDNLNYLNCVVADPFHFDSYDKRVVQSDGRMF